MQTQCVNRRGIILNTNQGLDTPGDQNRIETKTEQSNRDITNKKQTRNQPEQTRNQPDQNEAKTNRN